MLVAPIKLIMTDANGTMAHGVCSALLLEVLDLPLQHDTLSEDMRQCAANHQPRAQGPGTVFGEHRLHQTSINLDEVS